MIVRSLRRLPYALELARPRRTAAGVVSTRRGVVLGVIDDRGRCGWGDAVVRPSAEGGAGARALEALADEALVGRRFRHPSDIRTWLAEAALPSGAAYAVELALLDLLAQAAALPVAALIGEVARREIETAAVIENAEEAGAALAGGARALKMKVGGRAVDEDVAAVRAVRAAVGPEPLLRLDANGAWDVATAGRALEALAPLGIEMLEEPIARDGGIPSAGPLRALRALPSARGRQTIPIALDESLAEAPELLAEADIAVLKPAALGGLLACVELASRAGRACVASTAWESAIGRAGAVHLAAVLPGPTRVAGLGGPFSRDLAAWPPPGAATLVLPAVGLGAEARP